MRLSSYHLTFSVAICRQSATADSTGPLQDTWLASRGELPPMPRCYSSPLLRSCSRGDSEGSPQL